MKKYYEEKSLCNKKNESIILARKDLEVIDPESDADLNIYHCDHSGSEHSNNLTNIFIRNALKWTVHAINNALIVHLNCAKTSIPSFEYNCIEIDFNFAIKTPNLVNIQISIKLAVYHVRWISC